MVVVQWCLWSGGRGRAETAHYYVLLIFTTYSTPIGRLGDEEALEHNHLTPHTPHVHHSAMDKFVASNPGLFRRISSVFVFEVGIQLSLSLSLSSDTKLCLIPIKFY